MLVKIQKHIFDSLDDISLIWTCIEPTIQLTRGKSFAVKLDASSKLTDGQRALLMFQMLYGHSKNGFVEFFDHLSYLLSKKGVWSELKNGIHYFKDNDMVHLLEKVEKVYATLKADNYSEDSEWLNFTNIEDNSEIQMAINALDKQFREILPTTIELVGSYIRNYQSEFVEIEE